jgi:K+/H+ antiporter YhaU regulatory subunit KhtT
MTQKNDQGDLRQKIADLDEQLNGLTVILSKMMAKMDAIEEATSQMRDLIQKDIASSRGPADVEEI